MDAILISKREAALLLGVSPRTVDTLITNGELPTRRIGRRVLASRVSLEKFARRDHPTTANGGGDGQ